MFHHRCFEIYTDGGLKDGCGSWAFVILQNGRELAEESGRTNEPTTSVRMEFHAAIQALTKLKRLTTTTGTVARLHSDSRILIDNMKLWLPQWRRLGWTKADGRPLAGADQLRELDELQKRMLISWQWIKSHSGNEHNERCDRLCEIARDPNSVAVEHEAAKLIQIR